MDTRTRFLLGGVGGLAPIILFLINLDFERYVENASALTTVGYLVRAILLFLLGGFVAYLHETEQKRITLFLVGVSAPSLIAGYLSTASPNYSQYGATDVTGNQTSLGFVITSAFAQEVTSTSTDGLKKFTLPPQSAGSQFLEGLLGISPKNVWFVIVGSYLDRADAEKSATSFNKRFAGYHAEVYAPYGKNPYYAVVIGANLTQAEAKALRDKAVKEGFPQDSYYKTFPGLRPAK